MYRAPRFSERPLMAGGSFSPMSPCDPFQTLRPVSGSTEARWKTGRGFEANRLGELLSAHLPNFGSYVLRPAASKQQETRLTPRFADSEP